MSNFDCETCFDTGLIDQGGREVYCPACKPVIQVKITGLQHGLGSEGRHYSTAAAYTSSTIVFRGYKGDILRDVHRVRVALEACAKAAGLKGRNSMTSGAVAIEKRVKEALS